MKSTLIIESIVLILFFGVCTVNGQQVPDTSYNPSIENPAYNSKEGPNIYIDEAHYNFHTMDGRYRSFATLLERDGYNVKPFKEEFTLKNLAKVDILVISNALNKINETYWVTPNPSAFTRDEIISINFWVSKGGKLFLIADHMPIAGAAQDLAESFGFAFTNGFVFHKDNSRGPAIFSIENKGLQQNIITQGRDENETVSEVASFTGQAFQIPIKAQSILQLDYRYINMLPDTAWVFHKGTKRLETVGWSQGAFSDYGKGRIVVFGEAAMFSAQLAGKEKRKMGMNNPVASENHQLLLNIIHWLDGIIE